MIKLFEQFNNEQEIHNICKEYNIENYTINTDGSIDVNGGVNLNEYNLTRFPIIFNKVNGNFSCCDNKLSTLEGGPKEVSNFFDCSNNKLTSLIGSPMEIGQHFYCDKNKLTSLEGGPIIIDGDFLLRYNPISIIDSSIEIRGEVYMYNTNFDEKIRLLSQEKLRILFEHGVDYDIFRKDGSINDSRLERLFKDFNI